MSDPTPQDPQEPTPQPPQQPAPETVIGHVTVGDTEGGDGREVTGEDANEERPDKAKQHDSY